MRLERINLEVAYAVDMITNEGHRIEADSEYEAIDISKLINGNEFTDTEYRCTCGSFKGQDLVGRVCPKCGDEIMLHSLNFGYTGWIDLGHHKIISPAYFPLVKKCLSNSMLKFILGDYKDEQKIVYRDYEETENKRKVGRKAANHINILIKKIPAVKHCYKGLGHDVFYQRFEEIMNACSAKKYKEDGTVAKLIQEKECVFSSKIPVYSTAFRPISKTSETLFYSPINKFYSVILADSMRIDSMLSEIEVIHTLNDIQNNWVAAVDYLTTEEMAKKTGYIRSEIVGGTFEFSGRSVITLDDTLASDEVAIPFNTAITVYQYMITHRLSIRNHMTLEQAYLYVRNHKREPLVRNILDEIINEGQWCLYLREPTDNLKSMILAKVVRYKMDDDTLSVPVEILSGANGDFDGDALAMQFLPAEMAPMYEAFHFSWMKDCINGTIPLELREWTEITLGVMSL